MTNRTHCMENKAEKVLPYGMEEGMKKKQIEKMFDNIALQYDFLNHFLSAGIDITWRKRAIQELKSIEPKTILDMATGTGDFAFEARSLYPNKIIGVDLSQNMLQRGIEKSKQKSCADLISFEKGDAENLNYESSSFDAITVGFGVRNFASLKNGLTELHRVLRPGGRIVILEPSFPRSFPMKQLFSIHFHYITPFLGRLFSKDASAYTYLPDSVKAFPQGADFLKILEDTGFKNTKHISLTFGICALYIGDK